MIVLQRAALVDEILMLATSGDSYINVFSSIIILLDERKHCYFRGPRGSGKSVLMRLIAEKLKERGDSVFLFKGLSNLTLKNFVHFDDKLRAENKIAYLLFDELGVMDVYYQDIWIFLLKECTNLVIIGTGIPSLEGKSLTFLHKIPASRILLTEDELLEASVVDAFVAMIPAQAQSRSKHLVVVTNKTNDTLAASDTIDLSIRETVQLMLEWLLKYTGGHAYPLLKLAEYLIRDRTADMLDRRFEAACGEQFKQSDKFRKILVRSYTVETKVKFIASEILTKGIKCPEHEMALIHLGLWSERRNWFISDLFLFYLLLDPADSAARREPALTGTSLEKLQKLLEIGLGDLSENHFKQYDDRGFSITRYENAIGYYLAWKLSRIERLSVSPQHQVPGIVPRPRTGPNPTIDLYIDGGMDLFLELIRDGSLAEIVAHDDKFRLSTGGYHHHRDRYALLNIVTKTAQPVILPDEPMYQRLHDICYTFVKDSNLLFRGNLCIKCNVSSALPFSPIKRTYSNLRIGNFCKGVSYFFPLVIRLLKK